MVYAAWRGPANSRSPASGWDNAAAVLNDVYAATRRLASIMLEEGSLAPQIANLFENAPSDSISTVTILMFSGHAMIYERIKERYRRGWV